MNTERKVIAHPVKVADLAHALQGFADFDLSPPVFPLLEVPPLIPASRKASDGSLWELKVIGAPPLARGYYRALMPVPHRNNFFALTETRVGGGSRTWMSLAMMELESQSQAAHLARGRVLVGGLGMGAMVWTLLRKEEVERVTVIESNPTVIDLLAPSIAQWNSALRRKLNIVQGDMLAYRSNDAYDAAIIDIWPCVGDSALRKDMQRIARNLPKAKVFSAWGMELDFVTWLADQGYDHRSAQANPDGLFAKYCRKIRVNLMGQDDPRMVELATRAAINQFNS